MLFHTVSFLTSRWAQNAEASGGSASQMLLMGFAPVMSMTQSMQNIPVRILKTFLFARKGCWAQIFIWFCLLLYGINAPIRNIGNLKWASFLKCELKCLSYFPFPLEFVKPFMVKMLSELCNKGLAQCLRYCELIVNILIIETIPLGVVNFMIRIDNLDE